MPTHPSYLALPPKSRAFFEAFLAQSDDPDKWAARRVMEDGFGDSPEMADELLALVLAGTKTASCTCRWEWEAEGEEPQTVGTLGVILDGGGAPACILETTSMEEVAYRDVTPEHARAEGEGDRSLAYWRRVHWDWFTRSLAKIGREPSEDMPVLYEGFRVVWKIKENKEEQ